MNKNLEKTLFGVLPLTGLFFAGLGGYIIKSATQDTIGKVADYIAGGIMAADGLFLAVYTGAYLISGIIKEYIDKDGDANL